MRRFTEFTFALLVLLSSGTGFGASIDKKLAPYDSYIQTASRIYGVRAEFIKAVIMVESAGRHHIVSKAGAIGLMQIMPIHAKKLGFPPEYLKDPKINIMVGTRLLKELLYRYKGDAVLALAAYNAGIGAISKYKGVPPYKETRLYIRRVLKNYAKALGIKAAPVRIAAR